MTDKKRNQNTVSGVIDSMAELGAASTKLAIDQVQNVLTGFVNPGAAVEHATRTMNSLSAAMNDAAGDGKTKTSANGASWLSLRPRLRLSLEPANGWFQVACGYLREFTEARLRPKRTA